MVGDSQALGQRDVELEAENAGLRELVAERDRQLEQMAGRLTALDATQRDADDGAAVNAEDERGGHGLQGAAVPARTVTNYPGAMSSA